jgi:hypothetical protein
MSEEEKKIIAQKMANNPFIQLQQNFSSYFKINKEMESSPHFIPPLQFKLPRNANGKECPFQYVPIIETVKLIVSDPDFAKLHTEPTPDGYLYDIKDASTWKTNPFFLENPEALTGQLYSDAVELDNPLGPSKGVHKALNVYFSLIDIPKPLRTKTNNIFLVLTVLEKDLQKDQKNYQRFFKPLVDDLKKLEAGVEICGKTVKMGLICYSADNLEASMVGGFSQCYSSYDICRICHQQHKDLQKLSGIPKVARWTQEEYNLVVQNLTPGIRGEFGLNSECVFNELQSFHCIGQIPTDVMHDFCEKIACTDVMSLLTALVNGGTFTWEEYNKLLREVKLGDYEASDRPRLVNSRSATIGGKAMSVALHLRLLPYFLWRILRGNFIESNAIDLVIILARMLEFIMADKLSMADIRNFEELVVDFFEKRAICVEQYGNFCSMTPKYHHLGKKALQVSIFRYPIIF